MKLPRAKFASSGRGVSPLTAARCETPSPAPRVPLVHKRAFTLIEIAICLAIIGFALVAIIGVLPLGMDTQRQVREETDINQDFSVLLEAIRSGASGPIDLRNYFKQLKNEGPPVVSKNIYTNNSRSTIGFLSTPGGSHIQAYVRSLSGLAAQKPPQDNNTIRNDSFTYQLVCVNVPGGISNLYELRMTFLWPLLGNNKFGSGRQTFRATIAGQLKQDATDPYLWFYQPHTFAP